MSLQRPADQGMRHFDQRMRRFDDLHRAGENPAKIVQYVPFLWWAW
jgi:hypothetical protein